MDKDLIPFIYIFKTCRNLKPLKDMYSNDTVGSCSKSRLLVLKKIVFIKTDSLPIKFFSLNIIHLSTESKVHGNLSQFIIDVNMNVQIICQTKCKLM